MFVYSFSRANIIAVIPLVRGGAGVLEMGKGLRGVFWSLFRKRKWSSPLYRHCMRTVATSQRLDYPNVFVLVLSVTVMYTVQVEERDWREQPRALSYNCQSLSHFPAESTVQTAFVALWPLKGKRGKTALTSTEILDGYEENLLIV